MWNPGKSMFLFGPPNVEKLKTKLNVPGLVKAMEYKKESSDSDAVEVRRQAAVALGEIGDAAGIDALIAALQDVHEQVREAASQALMKINDSRAAEPFIDMWIRGTESERVAITAILVKMGSPAVQALISMLGHNNLEFRETVAKLLGKIGAPAVEPLVADLDHLAIGWDKRMAIADALARIGPPAIEPLTGLLIRGGVVKQQVAARALKQMNWHPTRDAAGAFFWILNDKPKKCVAIGAPAVEALIDGLMIAPLTDTRKECMLALFRIGDPRAIPALIAYLKNAPKVLFRGGGYNEDHEAAANYLVGFGGKAVEPLLDMLKDYGSRERATAARLLGRIGDARAIGPLTILLKDHDDAVVTAVQKALSQIVTAEAANSSESAPPPPDGQESIATDIPG